MRALYKLSAFFLGALACFSAAASDHTQRVVTDRVG